MAKIKARKLKRAPFQSHYLFGIKVPPYIAAICLEPKFFTHKPGRVSHKIVRNKKKTSES